jgi:hypothetical protein
MMGSPVEFVDDSPDSGAVEARRRGWRFSQLTRAVEPLLSGDKLRLAAAICWAASAALCVIASFQTVFTYRFDGTAIHTRGGFTASGRSLDPILSSEHGPRYAIAFFVCAGWFVVLAVVHGRSALGGREGMAARHVAVLGVAGTFLLVGLLSGLGLALESTYSSYNSLAGALSENGDIGVRLHLGGCLWFGLSALACAAAALALTARLRRDIPAAPARDRAVATPPAEPHPPSPATDPEATDAEHVGTPAGGLDDSPEELLAFPRRASIRRARPVHEPDDDVRTPSVER